MAHVVLLIDEAQLERKMNEWNLMRAGYSAVTATTASQGLRMARDHMPDVIIMDTILSDPSYRQLLLDLRSNSQTAGIPVILLSRTPPSWQEAGDHIRVLHKERVLGEGRLLLDTVEEVLHSVL